MNLSIAGNKKTYLLLSLILLYTFVSRFWGLDYQSLWFDELHTMIECDPKLKISELLTYLRVWDSHPPLLYFLTRLMFNIFGYTSFAARLLPVIAGTVSVWVIFLLGKEILNKNLGLIAAALTSVNYYHLKYSQEVRDYMLTFLFTALSFLFLIRLIKTLSVKNSILYAVFTLLLLFSHYYSLFVLVSQIVLIIVFFFLEDKSNRAVYAKRFVLGGLLVAIGYSWWIPYLMAVSHVTATWMTPIGANFFIDFFYTYFGNATLINPMLTVLLLIYAVKVLSTGKQEIIQPKKNPLIFSFIVLSGWVVVTYLVPYLRSLFIAPMMLPRYTIVVLPAYLIAIAYGIELINNKRIKTLVLSVFILFSIIDIAFISKYYTTVSKTQFREMTGYVVDNNKENYPIINEVTFWQQQFYFRINNFKPVMLTGKKAHVVDSLLQVQKTQNNIKGFWIVGAHGDKPLTPEQRKVVDSTFTVTKEKKFLDAWAQLYVPAVAHIKPPDIANDSVLQAGTEPVQNSEVQFSKKVGVRVLFVSFLVCISIFVSVLALVPLINGQRRLDKPLPT